MQIIVVTPGKIRSPYLRDGCHEFLSRLGHYARTDVIETREEAQRPGLSLNELKNKEGARLLERIPDGAFVIVLDERGKGLASRDLADLLRRERDGGRKTVACVVGGAQGLPPTVTDQAHLLWSLSNLTFPHELARLILLEQLYRAFTILHGEPYHHGG